MMVMPEFAGDDNRTLMDIQHSAYGEMVSRLFVAPRNRYLAAATLLQVEDKLSNKLRVMDGFDHRTLQLAHDRIAAYFRFHSPNSSQLLLGEQESAHAQRLREGWRDFFSAEVEDLTLDDEFTRAICAATAFGNSDAGIAAEQWLDQFLRHRYAVRGLAAWTDPNRCALRLPVCFPEPHGRLERGQP